MNKTFKTIIVLSVLATAVCITSSGKANAMVTTNQTNVESVAKTTAKEGWVKENGNWYYYLRGSKYTNRWLKYKGDLYYFNEDGIMHTGWLKHELHYSITGKDYWMYFDSNGKMCTGLKKIGKYWYFFNTDPDYLGAMIEGKKLKAIDYNGEIHVFNEKGQAYKGWQYIDKNWYYFEDSGIPALGKKIINKKCYLFVNNNANHTKVSENNRLLFGRLAKNQFVNIGDDFYYANKDGIPVTGWKKFTSDQLKGGGLIIKGESCYMYFNSKGIAQTGWKIIDNKKYFFITKQVYKDNFDKYIDNNDYYYKSMYVGKMAGYYKSILKINDKYYCFNKNGTLRHGWYQNYQDWYYFNSNDNTAVIGWYKINKKWYYFNTEGIMQTGFQKINGKWYFLNTNNSKGTEGSLYYGWIGDNSNWYYFDKDKGGAALVSTYKKIGNKVYKFNASGVCLNPDN